MMMMMVVVVELGGVVAGPFLGLLFCCVVCVVEERS